MWYFIISRACSHFIILFTTSCQSQFIQQRCHIIKGFMGNFVRILCSITKAFVRRSKWPRLSQTSLRLWGHFGIQGSKISRQKIRAIFQVGSSSTSLWHLDCFKESLSYDLVRVCKNSQTLWEHMKNGHKELKKTWEKVRSFSKWS